MSDCQNCPHLQAQVSHLQAENRRLLIEVAMLRRIIADARAECMALANEADGVMAGHVPRGTWALARGRKEAAVKVLERLRG